MITARVAGVMAVKRGSSARATQYDALTRNNGAHRQLARVTLADPATIPARRIIEVTCKGL